VCERERERGEKTKRKRGREGEGERALITIFSCFQTAAEIGKTEGKTSAA
jgi:hypothetical protein